MTREKKNIACRQHGGFTGKWAREQSTFLSDRCEFAQGDQLKSTTILNA